jgi:hypothetical protein
MAPFISRSRPAPVNTALPELRTTMSSTGSSVNSMFCSTSTIDIPSLSRRETRAQFDIGDDPRREPFGWLPAPPRQQFSMTAAAQLC